MTDDDYLALVFETLESVIAGWHPDFVIYDAGSDVHVTMRLVDYRLQLTVCIGEIMV